MGAKKESTLKRNQAIVSDVLLLQVRKKSPGQTVDWLMDKYKISFRTLTNILRSNNLNLST
jgi:hypothetical protein